MFTRFALTITLGALTVLSPNVYGDSGSSNHISPVLPALHSDHVPGHSLSAAESPLSREEFCARNFESIRLRLLDPQSRMSFVNYGGLGGGGVCWWHSRFQRAALYLTRYLPELPKPSSEEARRLIWKISRMREVVEIPGFENFNSFTESFQDEIESRLEQWQKIDGFLEFAWIDGLRGHSSVSSEDLKSLMDRLYDEVEGQGQLAFTKLQLPGIVSHAWIIPTVVRTTDGYLLFVVDSNEPDLTRTYSYHVGDIHFELAYAAGYSLVPYPEKEKDLSHFRESIEDYCRSN